MYRLASPPGRGQMRLILRCERVMKWERRPAGPATKGRSGLLFGGGDVGFGAYAGAGAAVFQAGANERGK